MVPKKKHQLTIHFLADSTVDDESNEYCITEVFKAECPENHVIVMRRSRYGRMRIGRCVRTDFGFVGCQADVLHVTDSRCSGRRRCSVRVADSLFEQTTVSGCNAELKFYLEASYDCVPGEYLVFVNLPLLSDTSNERCL